MEGRAKKLRGLVCIAGHALVQPTILATVVSFLPFTHAGRLAQTSTALFAAMKRLSRPYEHVTSLCAAGLYHDNSFPVALCAGGMKECMDLVWSSILRISRHTGSEALEQACLITLCRQGRLDLLHHIKGPWEWNTPDRFNVLSLIKALAYGQSPAITLQTTIDFYHDKYAGEDDDLFLFDDDDYVESQFHFDELVLFVADLLDTRGFEWACKYACIIAEANMRFARTFLHSLIDHLIEDNPWSDKALECVEMVNYAPLSSVCSAGALRAHLSFVRLTPHNSRIKELITKRLCEMEGTL